MKDKIIELMGKDAQYLLEHKCSTVPKSDLHLPGPDFVDRLMSVSDRPNSVLRNLQTVFDHGRLARTGYLSILPVDQGIEQFAIIIRVRFTDELGPQAEDTGAIRFDSEDLNKRK